MSHPFKTDPFKHQVTEFEAHRDSPARALLWQMRTGKSKAVVDLACYLWEDALAIDGVLLVAPNNVHLNWQTRELPRHHWDSVPLRTLVWDASRAGSPEFEAAFDALCSDRRRLCWLMVNVEAFALEKPRKYISRFVRSRSRFLAVADEVHEFRWETSKRYAGLRAVMRRAAVRRILSANPLDNSPLHAYAEFNLLGEGALGFEDYASFEARYAEKGEIYVPGGYTKSGVKRSPRKREAVVGYRNEEELRERIARWSSLVLRSDVEDMPELLRGQVDFELHPTQKRLHNALVDETLARLDCGTVIPPAEGGVLVVRLQQIASGYTVDADGNVVEVLPDKDNPRLQALLQVVREVPGKFIVWCRFREDVVRVTRFLTAKGFLSVDYYGGTSKRDRAIHERDFREDPKTVGLVGQFQAGGQGLDFSTAGDIIWFSHTTDLLRRRQADERATKIGGRRIGLTDLVAVGSNDAKMLGDLEGRAERADFLTGNGLRRYLTRIQ